MKLKSLLVAGAGLLGSTFLNAQDINVYAYKGLTQNLDTVLSKEIFKNMGVLDYFIPSQGTGLNANYWVKLPVQSGDTIEVALGESYVVEWSGLKEIQGTSLDYVPSSTLDDPLNDNELNRYDGGNRRGVLFYRIDGVDPEQEDIFRTVKMTDANTGTDLGSIVLKEVPFKN